MSTCRRADGQGLGITRSIIVNALCRLCADFTNKNSAQYIDANIADKISERKEKNGKPHVTRTVTAYNRRVSRFA